MTSKINWMKTKRRAFISRKSFMHHLIPAQVDEVDQKNYSQVLAWKTDPTGFESQQG